MSEREVLIKTTDDFERNEVHVSIGEMRNGILDAKNVRSYFNITPSSDQRLRDVIMKGDSGKCSGEDVTKPKTYICFDHITFSPARKLKAKS